MARKGENIYKRKDGRWEARFIASRDEKGQALDEKGVFEAFHVAKVADAFWRFRKEPLLTIVANDDGKYVGIVAEHDYDMVGLTQGGY